MMKLRKRGKRRVPLRIIWTKQPTAQIAGTIKQNRVAPDAHRHHNAAVASGASSQRVNGSDVTDGATV
jgi:hypothetical protein